jgi:sulfite reductase (ferredoxin)
MIIETNQDSCDELTSSETGHSFTPRELAQHGIFPQGESNLYFIRTEVFADTLTPPQICAVAEAAHRWGQGKCHLSSQPALQIHNIAPATFLPVLKFLDSTGLICNPNDRLICSNLSICHHHQASLGSTSTLWDYSQQVRSYLRKFTSLPTLKIAITCSRCMYENSVIPDLHIQIRTIKGNKGFRFLLPKAIKKAQILFDFIPSAKLLVALEAFLNLTVKLSREKNQSRSELSKQIETIGVSKFREQFDRLLLNISDSAENDRTFELQAAQVLKSEDPALLGNNTSEESFDRKKFHQWKSSYVTSSANLQIHSIELPISGGNASVLQLETIASLVEHYHLSIRLTQHQSFKLLGIKAANLRSIYLKLRQRALAGLSTPLSFVVCPGSPYCIDGLTDSQALANVLMVRLGVSSPIIESMNHLGIKISGCLKNCNQNSRGDVVLEGKAQHQEGQWMPTYQIRIRFDLTSPELEIIGTLPARRIPGFLSSFLKAYQNYHAKDQTFQQIVQRMGLNLLRHLVELEKGRTEAFPGEACFDWGRRGCYHPPAQASNRSKTKKNHSARDRQRSRIR